MNTETPNTTQEPFSTWAILELLGHRKLVGLVTEVELAGTKMLRIDVTTRDGKQATQFYSTSAVYCLTPTTEATAKAYVCNSVAPVSPYELLPAPGPDTCKNALAEAVDDDDEFAAFD